MTSIASFSRWIILRQNSIDVRLKLCFRARVAFDDSLWIKGVCISSIILFGSRTPARNPLIYYREMRNISLFLLKYFALSQTPIPTTSTSTAIATTVQSMAGNYSGVPTPRPTVNPNGFNPVFGNIFIVQTEYLRKWFLAQRLQSEPHSPATWPYHVIIYGGARSNSAGKDEGFPFLALQN